MPPDGVRTRANSPSTIPAALTRSKLSNPDVVCDTSTSTTSMPEVLPVGRPMFAPGQRVHHARTTPMSQLASRNPAGVYGRFPPRVQGKIGTPRRANASAASLTETLLASRSTSAILTAGSKLRFARKDDRERDPACSARGISLAKILTPSHYSATLVAAKEVHHIIPKLSRP